MMQTFEFSIVASGLDPNTDNFESQFYDHGCDDALVSFQKGHVIVDFARNAESFEEALLSAVEAVWNTGATIDRIEPDPLVSLSDIAFRVNMTRAAVTQYAKGQRRGGFPVPVAKVTSDSPLWQWDVVATWFYEQGKVCLSTVLEAHVVRDVNTALCAGNRNIREVLASSIAKRAA